MMKTQVVQIDPATAREWLMRNTINRVLRPRRADDFREIWERGEWKVTHQGIAFNEDGNLADGQHRLTFIASLPDSEKVPLMVTWGVANDAYFGMDRGATRTNSDILAKDKRLVEVARFVASIYTGKSNITPEYLLPFVNMVEAEHDALMSFCATTCKTWSATPVRAAAVIKVLFDGNRDYVHAVYRSMVHHDFEAMPKVAQSLFSAYMRGSVRAADKYDILCRVLKVMDRGNASLTKVQIKDTSKVMASIRSYTKDYLARLDAEGQKNKEPVFTRGPKSVLRANYRLEGL